ncbi:MAG: hypothetical protein ACLPWF_22960 [Bryobacteraceae bacterium]|jgi:hypothetical protein
MISNDETKDANHEGQNREKQRRREKSLSAELLAIGKRCAAHMKRPVKSSDHAGMLYDSKGLPR